MVAGPQSNSPSRGLFAVRYRSLDSFRGIAALAVVVHHAYDIHVGNQAVIMFFVISGYCIAAASESCRRAGIGLRGFMRRRLHRIYPPYLLSLLFWAVTRVLKMRAGGTNDLVHPPLVWFQNVTLTQWTALLVRPGTYPPDNPALFVSAYWSLCYEEQFYVIMGLLFTASSLSAAVSRRAVVALMAIGLAWTIVFPHVIFGVFIEYWCPFGIGVLVYLRLCAYSSLGARRAVDVTIALIGVVAGVIFWRAGGFPAALPGGREVRGPAGELLVAAAFGLLLVGLRPFDGRFVRSRWSIPLRWLGTVTYSVYLVHVFVLPFAKRLAEAAWRGRGGALPAHLTQLAIVVGVGSLFWYLCERPFLNRPMQKRQDPSAPGV
jgi:peptidoglycan/LPS O-acetylase OafA/YrhL